MCVSLIAAFISGCAWRAGTAPTADAGSAPKDYALSLTSRGLSRAYALHTPGNYDPAVPLPLVIYLHGGGGSNVSAHAEGLDAYADRFRFILAAPNGTGRLSDRLLTWNAGAWSGGTCCGYAVQNNVDDVGFIADLIDDAARRFAVDARRVYVTGHSNGGMMAYRTACELASRIAAVAPVAPPASPRDCTPARPVSIMHVHGTVDPCAPYAGGPGGGCLLGITSTFSAQSAQQMVDDWRARDSITSAPTSVYRRGNADCQSYRDDRAEVEFCTITGGGHTWPDGDPALPTSVVGPVSHDMSFEQIWDFFSRHRLP